MTREEVIEYIGIVAKNGSETHAMELLDHDAAQRAEIERLQREVAQYHQASFECCDLRTKAEQERDRLREALEALWRMTFVHKITDRDAHAVIRQALDGRG